jgi:hypothetical protein
MCDLITLKLPRQLLAYETVFINARFVSARQQRRTKHEEYGPPMLSNSGQSVASVGKIDEKIERFHYTARFSGPVEYQRYLKISLHSISSPDVIANTANLNLVSRASAKEKCTTLPRTLVESCYSRGCTFRSRTAPEPSPEASMPRNLLDPSISLCIYDNQH